MTRDVLVVVKSICYWTMHLLNRTNAWDIINASPGSSGEERRTPVIHI